MVASQIVGKQQSCITIDQISTKRRQGSIIVRPPLLQFHVLARHAWPRAPLTDID
jgi:hypothetical protein